MKLVSTVFMFDAWKPLMGENSVHLANGDDAKERVALYNRCLSGPGLKQLFPIFNKVIVYTHNDMYH